MLLLSQQNNYLPTQCQNKSGFLLEHTLNYLPCEIIETQPNTDASVIWLHGLGASGHDFVPVIPQLQLPKNMAVRFVFPHAPTIPITINAGMIMPGWYDVLNMDMGREIDEDQIMSSAQAISALIDREISLGNPSQRIVLSGFSQGGAVTYQAALSYPQPLAGILILSSYFPTHKTILPAAANRQLPIQVFHGTYDPVVPEALGIEAVDALKRLNYHPNYKSFPMQHEVLPQEIQCISAWLQQILT
jgi:phospholipase/carboxylesterase